MKKRKMGLIGADPNLRSGMVGTCLPEEEAEITAVADINPEMLKAYQEKYPDRKAFFTTRVDELLKQELDGVFIMVRDCYHEDLAVKALEAGKAVYLEKPMAITIEGCDRILETAYRTGSKLFLGHNMRYMPFVRKMKEIIDSGIIGEIQCVWVRHFVNYGSCYFHHWCAERKNCTGLLLQKGAHDIDVIQWLAGGAPKHVSAMGKLSVYNRTTDRLKDGEKPDRKIAFTDEAWPPLEQKKLSPRIDVEDHNMILMQLDNGVQATYMHCMYAPDSERNYTFIGTHGRVENIGDGGEGTQIHVWTCRGRRSEPDIVYHLKPLPGTAWRRRSADSAGVHPLCPGWRDAGCFSGRRPECRRRRMHGALLHAQRQLRLRYSRTAETSSGLFRKRPEEIKNRLILCWKIP